jgi:cytochrome c peroxidase
LNRLTNRCLRSIAAVVTAFTVAPSYSADDFAVDSAGRDSETSVRLGLPARPAPSAEERAAHLKQVREWYERDPALWPAPLLDEGVEHRELGPIPAMMYPADNPADPAKESLGKQLFFEPRLSGSRQIACASCHDPDLGWSDGRTTSFGHNRRKLARNAPSILNGGYRRTLFWDGRASSLEAQAVAVLSNVDEMHSGDEVVVTHLSEIPEYVEAFHEVFGVDQPRLDEVAKALGAFERTIVSEAVRFDSFVAGRYNAMTDEELSGLHLFRTDARCLNCHNGPLLTDDKFHNIGLSFYGRAFEDLGRYNVTGEAADVGAFRTPSLRDVTRTGPYMHNGLFDIDELLRLYNAGMPNDRIRADETHKTPAPTKSPHLRPLGLNAIDLADLAAFLESLEESHRKFPTPKLPPGL